VGTSEQVILADLKPQSATLMIFKLSPKLRTIVKVKSERMLIGSASSKRSMTGREQQPNNLKSPKAAERPTNTCKTTWRVTRRA